ncbi:DNA methyltransferase [Tepidimicrobium xylanilyticum]|uniref:site-specific DNA-methyltransferase (cytosine-N(4)-specific) n=1 Tax=Tepidimicrobium xylanilyticum TaxID=1123352 RepID=A0A1H2R394_9FIRM|nr:DNA methyltransferase [Tepidimicrobium xylanilyticum]SDW13857.1 DNA methylase [Tepidimicrobium xylanilyticum]
MSVSQDELMTIQEASQWASSYLNREVTASNISYLIQYGRIRKIDDNGNTRVLKGDLIKYYDSYLGKREINWKKQLGYDLNWELSFDNLKESDTTKHVHRLHPYKGKFIPQLVEYFLDDHIDDYKKEVYFRKGDIVLDPFCGSGTTLVQANELGIHAIGVDVSEFNAFISNAKIGKYDLQRIKRESDRILKMLSQRATALKILEFEEELSTRLSEFNSEYFPSPEFKRKVRNKEIDAKKYGREKEEVFLSVYEDLIHKYDIELKQDKAQTFLDKWYIKNIREEIDLAFSLINEIEDLGTRRILGLILSRTMRSCRATTHSDLATLKEPVLTPYYCHKHGKICKPLFTLTNWFCRYSEDAVNRLEEFHNIRTNSYQICLTGDSRSIDIFAEIEKENKEFYELLVKNKINGIFTSPPYVGLIDYHEQHAYAYELFGFNRRDDLEIGPLYKG